MALYGYALYQGICVPQDFERSEQLLTQSRHILAKVMRLIEMPVPNADDSSAVAFRLLTTECDLSDPHVQYLLGTCWRNGLGCTMDKVEGVSCFERAGNHVLALYFLGLAFYIEQGAPRDYVRAAQLYRQAADQGYDWAQHALGMMYFMERGVPLDPQQAKHYIQMAAAQGNQQAVSWCDTYYNFDR
eukprot:TRINITY_DN4463_c0_g1_i4.p1 TRINITY_DN4463_c0_g1~~TRINITY_DN4463_c0_g1_i4.p1  ORF type:complete len:211 (+),score=37.71 TRINITY_DN4463_c0_g1_i4:74-634(+)